jgi:hypothetical protein
VPRYLWGALVVLTALEAARELFNLGGPETLYETWFPDIVLGASAALVLLRAGWEPKARSAWLAIGLAMAAWFLGNALWSLVYGSGTNAPYPSFADVLWLLWYPLMALGIFLLVRLRVPRFELSRWMDGLAIVFLVLAIGVAVVIEPDLSNEAHGNFATIVGFSYPILDVLLIGAILGVFGLLGWRPDRVFVLLGLGTLATTTVDATFAVQEAKGLTQDTHYAFVWTLGAVLIAYAAWVRAPETAGEVHEVVGLRAVALPLAAQAFAIGIQIYAYFEPVAPIERLITVAVLAVSCVQIFLTRPRLAANPVDQYQSKPEAQE